MSALEFPGYLQGSFAGYEQGLCALGSLMVWRITGHLNALEVAYRLGRLIATTIFIDGAFPNETIDVGLFVHFRGDGTVQQRGQGLIEFAGDTLRIWSIAGLNAYLGAWEAMRTLGIAGEAIDTQWLAHARRAREILTGFPLINSGAETLPAVSQTLWNVDPVLLGRRV